jgi:tellurite resistance protein TehA-like permease
MTTKRQRSLRDVTALWLLPVVTLIVASSGGGELVQALSTHTTTGALITLASAACTLSIGLALASAILTLYFYRLILHGFPETGVLSAFVPLGPMGQAGVAALLLGQGARTLLPLPGNHFGGNAALLVGECVYVGCVCAALGLWALATLWLGYALLGIQHVVRRTTGAPPSFQLAYWGLIFPNVSYCNLVRSCLHIYSPGRVCESDDRVGSSTRCEVLPRLGRAICCPDAAALDRRVLQDGCAGPQWTDIRCSVFT